MVTSPNPKTMKMKGFRVSQNEIQKVTSPKWSRIIIQSCWTNLLIKFTIKMASQTTRDAKSGFFPHLLDFLIRNRHFLGLRSNSHCFHGCEWSSKFWECQKPLQHDLDSEKTRWGRSYGDLGLTTDASRKGLKIWKSSPNRIPFSPSPPNAQVGFKSWDASESPEKRDCRHPVSCWIVTAKWASNLVPLFRCCVFFV